MDLLIEWRTRDGTEHHERWPSVERFRTWALAEGMACAWTAYREDDEGEWEVIDRGTITRGR